MSGKGSLIIAKIIREKKIKEAGASDAKVIVIVLFLENTIYVSYSGVGQTPTAFWGKLKICLAKKLSFCSTFEYQTKRWFVKFV